MLISFLLFESRLMLAFSGKFRASHLPSQSLFIAFPAPLSVQTHTLTLFPFLFISALSMLDIPQGQRLCVCVTCSCRSCMYILNPASGG